MTAHLSPADIAAFHERRLDRARIEEIGAHVRACAECTRRLWDDPRIQDSATEVWNEPRRSRVRLRVAAAALLAALAGIGWWWIAREQPQQVEVPPSRPVPLPDTLRVIRDGATAITVDARGAVQHVGTPRAEWNALVADALRTGTPPRAAHPGLTGPGEILRGPDDEHRGPALLEPIGITVESTTPLFRWTPLAGARFRVVVARDGVPVARSEWLTDARWTPQTPLPRGQAFAWQLLVDDGKRERVIPSPEMPQARFHVLSETAVRELEDARASGSRLLTGLVAARHGLATVAARELDAFASQHAELAAATRLAKHYDLPAPTTTNADQ